MPKKGDKGCQNKYLFIAEPEPISKNLSSPDRISDMSVSRNQQSNLNDTFMSSMILNDEEEMPKNLLPKN